MDPVLWLPRLMYLEVNGLNQRFVARRVFCVDVPYLVTCCISISCRDVPSSCFCQRAVEHARVGNAARRNIKGCGMLLCIMLVIFPVVFVILLVRLLLVLETTSGDQLFDEGQWKVDHPSSDFLESTRLLTCSIACLFCCLGFGLEH